LDAPILAYQHWYQYFIYRYCIGICCLIVASSDSWYTRTSLLVTALKQFCMWRGKQLSA